MSTKCSTDPTHRVHYGRQLLMRTDGRGTGRRENGSATPVVSPLMPNPGLPLPNDQLTPVGWSLYHQRLTGASCSAFIPVLMDRKRYNEDGAGECTSYALRLDNKNWISRAAHITAWQAAPPSGWELKP